EFKVSPVALKTIAGIAALKVEGVASLAGGVVESVTDWLSKKDIRGIHVTIKNSDIFVDMHLSLKYGRVIREIAQNAQVQVRDALEGMLGKEVKQVNVFIDNIYFEESNL
ncbi:MAG: Asp23/Gls24 family envelope stress response protein, partial [Candidatus Subteraquimicrobiales bacterium]|nr:Asp23/Gls24 family envelope stress response protein [Candidatus Subteraquimicrobiales bacterium]